MKNISVHSSDRQALARGLCVQLGAIREAISMLEQGKSCIEIIQHLQRIEAALAGVNMELLNIHVTKCLTDLARSGHSEDALREISQLFCYLNRPLEKDC